MVGVGGAVAYRYYSVLLLWNTYTETHAGTSALQDRAELSVTGTPLPDEAISRCLRHDKCRMMGREMTERVRLAAV